MTDTLSFKGVNAGVVIAIVGAILGIVAVFLNWFDVSFLGYDLIKWTGFDFAFSSDFDGVNDFQRFAPFIAWIFAILTVIAAIMCIIKPSFQKIGGILMAVFGVLIIIFFIIWGVWEYSGIKAFDYAEIGVWLMMASGIIVVLAGIFTSVIEYMK